MTAAEPRETAGDHRPTITIGIPLHRSARWVENVCSIVASLPDDVDEILISDRTMLDDSAARLAALLAGDGRVRVLTGDDGLHWTDHFWSLLETARGEYFGWMMHDDAFDPSWVPTLASALRTNPDSWLAFGRLEMERVTESGTEPFTQWTPPDIPSGRLSRWQMLRLMRDGHMGIPFRGLMRRDPILARGLRVQRVRGTALADVAWCFRLAQHSPLVHVPDTMTMKRIHGGATFFHWKRTPGDLQRLAVDVLRSDGPGGLSTRVMIAAMRLDERRAIRRARRDSARPEATAHH